MSQKKTHKEYEDLLFERQIDAWPVEEYAGYDTPIKHTCLNGHETMRSPNNVLRNRKCQVCAGVNKVDSKGYIEKLVSKNIPYRPTEEYVNTDTPILHKCEKDHEWSIAPKHVLEGRICPRCAMVTGYYSESFFANNPEAGEQPGLLYCVVLVNKKTDKRTCVKIGIAKGTSNKDVLKRAGHFTGYDVRVQKVVHGKLIEIFYLEQYLHELWSDYKYTSDWKFGGYSELFEISKLKDILKSIPDKP